MMLNFKMKVLIIVNIILSLLMFRIGMMSKMGCLGGIEVLWEGRGVYVEVVLFG